jgi:hypothetical protein
MGGAQTAAQRPGGVPPEFRGLNTLDEPVCDTIVSSLIMLSDKGEKLTDYICELMLILVLQ